MLAVDLNNDRRDDLIVGAPESHVAGADQAGAIAVFRGSATGLSDSTAKVFTERNHFGGTNSPRDEFGYVGPQMSSTWW